MMAVPVAIVASHRPSILGADDCSAARAAGNSDTTASSDAMNAKLEECARTTEARRAMEDSFMSAVERIVAAAAARRDQQSSALVSQAPMLLSARLSPCRRKETYEAASS